MKRGSSGIDRLIGINKPQGMTSHDVISKCRKIFQEKRIGHTGTLDPMATGVLPILIGSATKLSNYLTSNTKSYEARISFGISTTTDDADGDILLESSIPSEVSSYDFAIQTLSRMLGHQRQLPPIYSAIKKNGKKSCDEARRGNVIELEPRDIEIFKADLIGMGEFVDRDSSYWDVSFQVSKGTYIRAIARDIGHDCGSCAHLSRLHRKISGNIGIDECISLETLARSKDSAIIDPVRALGFKISFCDDGIANMVSNGAQVPVPKELYELLRVSSNDMGCMCSTNTVLSTIDPVDGELVSMVHDNRLIAIYKLLRQDDKMICECGLQRGIERV